MRPLLMWGASHWAPPDVSLDELVRFRGAIWPKLNIPNLPWGPRPGSIDNIAVVDSIEIYDPPTRLEVIDRYKGLGFRDVPMGPCVDPGYHGQLPACDFRLSFDAYLDIAEMWERVDVRVNHFLRPDRGVAGLEWTIDDLNRELRPLFSTPRAQSLMRKVTVGWEPGPRYYYSNQWWVEMVRWMADVFPHALRSIHMVSDLDAPVGQDDDVKGITTPMAWANIAPYIHAWLVQNAGWTDGSSPIPSEQFIKDFTDQFNPQVSSSLINRFTHAYAGWPTFSAWGSNRGIDPIPAEFAAFGLYWKNFPFEQARRLGRLAIDRGAKGAFDGC